MGDESILAWCRQVLEAYRRDFPEDFVPGGRFYEPPPARAVEVAPKKKRRARRKVRA